jgi:quercetin dioxygenase-like cupin family protein
MFRIAAMGLAVIMLATAVAARAQRGAINQTANVKQIALQNVDVPESSYEVRFDIMEISPGAVARHTHPGPTLVYVLEGGFTLLMDGYPSRSFKAGDSFVEPAGVVHEGYGDGPTKIMVVFIVPRGQPLVTPAP